MKWFQWPILNWQMRQTWRPKEVTPQPSTQRPPGDLCEPERSDPTIWPGIRSLCIGNGSRSPRPAPVTAAPTLGTDSHQPTDCSLCAGPCGTWPGKPVSWLGIEGKVTSGYRPPLPAPPFPPGRKGHPARSLGWRGMDFFHCLKNCIVVVFNFFLN